MILIITSADLSVVPMAIIVQKTKAVIAHDLAMKHQDPIVTSVLHRPTLLAQDTTGPRMQHLSAADGQPRRTVVMESIDDQSVLLIELTVVDPQLMKGTTDLLQLTEQESAAAAQTEAIAQLSQGVVTRKRRISSH